MVRVTAFYAHDDQARFDWDYYVNQHLPLVRRLLGEGLLRLQAQKGLQGLAAGMPPLYTAMAHMDFASMEAMNGALLPHVATITADIAHYTSIPLQVQISEILD
ncbi:MAG: EthD family reductase [Bryobacterales bacterium]|nr:EthD family reductase [Bryobacterales bacterium]